MADHRQDHNDRHGLNGPDPITTAVSQIVTALHLGGTTIAVGPTPPSGPTVNDLWVDTS